jgi:membrane associated rhomboid family serine protease
MSFILLLGPLLEDRYGSGMLALMMTVTALVTGVINACFIPAPLAGSSGIAFMMILLASYTAVSHSEIPLSFLLVLALYLGRELLSPDRTGTTATFAHIAGGICGSMFGFLAVPARRTGSGTKRKDGETTQKSGGFL